PAARAARLLPAPAGTGPAPGRPSGGPPGVEGGLEPSGPRPKRDDEAPTAPGLRGVARGAFPESAPIGLLPVGPGREAVPTRPRDEAMPASDSADPLPRPRDEAMPASDSADPVPRPRDEAMPASDSGDAVPSPRDEALPASAAGESVPS